VRHKNDEGVRRILKTINFLKDPMPSQDGSLLHSNAGLTNFCCGPRRSPGLAFEFTEVLFTEDSALDDTNMRMMLSHGRCCPIGAYEVRGEYVSDRLMFERLTKRSSLIHAMDGKSNMRKGMKSQKYSESVIPAESLATLWTVSPCRTRSTVNMQKSMHLMRRSLQVECAGWRPMSCRCTKFACRVCDWKFHFGGTEPYPARQADQACPSRRIMAYAFARKRHKQSVLSLWYQAKLRKSPFLFFGLPFLSIVVLGSYALSGFTTIRYERHDQKVKIATEEDLLKLDKDRRRPDIREEYNVLCLQDC
jgi:Cytochrome c oxidase assembly protein COX16